MKVLPPRQRAALAGMLSTLLDAFADLQEAEANVLDAEANGLEDLDVFRATAAEKRARVEARREELEEVDDLSQDPLYCAVMMSLDGPRVAAVDEALSLVGCTSEEDLDWLVCLLQGLAPGHRIRRWHVKVSQ